MVGKFVAGCRRGLSSKLSHETTPPFSYLSRKYPHTYWRQDELIRLEDFDSLLGESVQRVAIHNINEQVKEMHDIGQDRTSTNEALMEKVQTFENQLNFMRSELDAQHRHQNLRAEVFCHKCKQREHREHECRSTNNSRHKHRHAHDDREGQQRGYSHFRSSSHRNKDQDHDKRNNYSTRGVLAKVRCYNCDERGHYSTTCPLPPRKRRGSYRTETQTTNVQGTCSSTGQQEITGDGTVRVQGLRNVSFTATPVLPPRHTKSEGVFQSGSNQTVTMTNEEIQQMVDQLLQKAVNNSAKQRADEQAKQTQTGAWNHMSTEQKLN